MHRISDVPNIVKRGKQFSGRLSTLKNFCPKQGAATLTVFRQQLILGL